MSALLRFWWSLCFAVMASATLGACDRENNTEESPNFRVLLPVHTDWRVTALDPYVLDLERFPSNGGYVGMTTYRGEVFNAPEKVVVEAIDIGLGDINCGRLQHRVQVRPNEHSRWVNVRSEAVAMSDNRQSCVLLLSWSRE